MPFSLDKIAVDLTANATTSEAQFAVGTVTKLSDGGEAVFVNAISTIAAFDAVGINAAGGAYPITTTNSVTSKRVGFAQTAITSSYYGWVQTGGTVKVNLASACADEVPLYTTATGGVLDDAVVSGGLIMGVTSTVTISNATAVTCIAVANAHVATGDMD